MSGLKKYIKVNWIHSFDDEPTWILSELDEDRYETRKVEIYSDGRADFADAESSSGTTLLGKVPVPHLDDVSSDPQFEVAIIDCEEFEKAWANAKSSRIAGSE